MKSIFKCGAVAVAFASVSVLSSAIAQAPVPSGAQQSKAPGIGGVITPVLPEKVTPYPTFAFPEKEMTKRLKDEEVAKLKLPITDDLGRIHYIVTLRDSATDAVPQQLAEGATNRFGVWHRPRMVNLNASLEKAYGYQATEITSWLLNSFSAYLTLAQVAALSKDIRVERVEENHWLQQSALWVDGRSNGANSPQVPWGVLALGGPKSANGTVNVWVIDSGVGIHSYLPNVFVRARIVATQPAGVGCYSHSTMVAGLIGAYAGSSDVNGVLGFNSNAKIGSITVLPSTNTTLNCANGLLDTSYIVNALDYIGSTTSTKVSVINLSIGGTVTGANSLANSATFKTAVLGVTQPKAWNPGAFFVQAAGNFGGDACQYIYVPPSGAAETADGIMVVAGIDVNGQPVVPLNTLGGYRNNPLTESNSWERGSNYGSCVDIWAPSNNLLSTGGGTTFGAKDQSGNTIYTTTKFVASGTSFAAPLVSAFAAYLIETDSSLTTPQLAWIYTLYNLPNT